MGPKRYKDAQTVLCRVSGSFNMLIQSAYYMQDFTLNKIEDSKMNKM